MRDKSSGCSKKGEIRMNILEFVSEIGRNLVELINSGIISFVVTKVAENTENKKVKKNIKERANVCDTSAPENIDSDEPRQKVSSDKIVVHITLKNCNVYINASPDKE